MPAGHHHPGPHHRPLAALLVLIWSGVVPAVAPAATLTRPYELDLIARQGDVVDGQRLDIFRGVALDDRGSVAYTAVAIDQAAQQLSGAALLLDGKKVVARGDSIASGSLGFLGEPDLGNDGSVAYSADVFQPGAGLSNTGSVFGQRSIPSGHRLVAGRDTPVGGGRLAGAINPTINAGGSLAYVGAYFDTVLNLNATAVVRDGGVVAATGDVVGNSVIDGVDRPSLSDRGDLAFEASLIDLTTAEASTAIFLNGLLAVESGSVTEDIDLMEVFSPSVNSRGDLAYLARFMDRQTDLDNMAVVLNGEVILESGDLSAEGLIFDRLLDLDINSRGQIALLAILIDPDSLTVFEEGVFLSRAVVPEAATGLSVALAISFAACRWRRASHAAPR